MIQKEEFISWKNSNAGQEQRAVILNQIEILGAEIIQRQESNPDRDMFVRGLIQAFVAVLDWEPEFPQESENQEEA